jgi:long-chain acyl-CoA synthetase
MPIESIAAIVRTWGAARPAAPAIELEGRSIVFEELDRRSNRVANALAAEGVAPQDRVAFIDKNGLPYFEVTFGLSKLNAVGAAVNWRLAPSEMAQVINDAKAKVAIVGPEFVPHLEKIRGQLPTVTSVVAIGGHDEWADYDQWVERSQDEDPGLQPAADDVAFQLYTSGTTGVPKGVMLTNSNFFSGLEEIAHRTGLNGDSVNLAVMPMFHIAGSAWALMGMALGSRTVVLREADPSGILRAIERFGVTHALFVPAVIQFLLATPGVESIDFSSLRTIVYGASPITDSVLEQAMRTFGCEMIQLYGLTETTGAICQLDGVDHDPGNRPHLLRSCGKPYPWIELRIVDPETGADAPTGVVGEVWTRSRQNMKGYWDNPAATAATVTPDGWLKTGDAAYLDDHGYVYLYDRVKDMIVSGGENVYPAEVENVITKHPEVADTAVIGVPDDTWGEAVKAIVVRRAGGTVGESEVIAFARDHLAGYKVPKSVDFTDGLPRTPSGKLLKRELREPYWAGERRRIH